MFIVEERKDMNNLIYRITSDGVEGFLRIVDIRRHVLEKDGIEYIMLYDSNEEVIESAFKYINKEMEEYTENYRSSLTTSIKLLYSYLDIFMLSISELSRTEVDNFINYLKGISYIKDRYQLDLKTKRSNIVVNKILGHIRDYLKYIGIENKYLNKRIVNGFIQGDRGLLGHTKKVAVERYVSNLETTEQLFLPEYINEEEYERIIEYVKENCTFRDEIIVRILYEGGARLGEVLGTTLEDIDNDCLIFRNRGSDKYYQIAKGCTRVRTTKNRDVGNSSTHVSFEECLLDRKLMKMINRYADENHGKMSKKRRANYLSDARADELDPNNYLRAGNFYLFLNKNGGHLGRSGWNKRLRKIFVACDIPIDTETRETNLSHRFRHGCAMKIRENGKTRKDVASKLRHHNLSSADIYWRPRREDRQKANDFGSESGRKHANLEGAFNDE